jgi:iron complex outermembrane recepter protein
MNKTHIARAAGLLAAVVLPNGALAQNTPAAGTPSTADTQMQEVVITGTVVQRALSNAPYAASVVGREALRSAGPLVNLSEALGSVPGVVVANRWNLAQDLQISSRGFGARAGFGVRGVRLYSDGIPASGPDGQGQVSHFDMAGAERVEVLRGPFSVLYGNSSGGVISIFSSTPKEARYEVAADAGSFGMRQVRAQVATPLAGGFSVRLGLAALEQDGFRPHSAAKRQLANLRVGWEQGADSVVALASYLDQPAQDPLGLTRAQFDSDPLSVASVAEQFDTRKTTRQHQVGARWRHRFGEGAGALRESTVALYSGHRQVQQFLAIAAATQFFTDVALTNPVTPVTPVTAASRRHGGGVVDFGRDFSGAEARLRFAWDGLDVVLGAASDRQRDARKGYENFTGPVASAVLGVVGRVRRDETNRAQSDDLFAQAEWALAERVTGSAGLRSGRVRMSTADAYIATGNRDDSGERNFSYTNPVLGLRWAAQPGLNVFASLAQGYESPTLGELAYRRDADSGLNTDLKAQRSRQFELGGKWASGPAQVDFTLFESRVADEISVATNAGGRSAFQNVGNTLRRGAELAARWRFAPGWRAAASLTWLDATYRDDFLVCAGIPCTAPTLPVAAGNRIAGTQGNSGFAELVWRSAGAGEFGLEVRGAGATSVNDRNTDAAGGYGLLGLRWTHSVALGAGWRGEWLLRVDNAADRRYAGSVIVNDANGRNFETGAPRSVLISLRLITP